MKDLAIKAVVTSPDGFHYREEREWRGMPAPEVADKWFLEKGKEVARLAAKVASSTKEDGDVLTAKLDAIIDGKVIPQFLIEYLSYTEFSKFQDIWDGWVQEMGKIRRERVKDKQDQHRKRGGKAKDSRDQRDDRGRDRNRDDR